MARFARMDVAARAHAMFEPRKCALKRPEIALTGNALFQLVTNTGIPNLIRYLLVREIAGQVRRFYCR